MNTPDRSGWRRRTQAGIAASTSAGLETRNDTQRGSIDSPSANASRSGVAPGARRSARSSEPSSCSMISWLRSSWDRRLPTPRRASSGAGKAASTRSSKKWANGPWPTSCRSPAIRSVSTTRPSEGRGSSGASEGSVERSDGSRARAQRPASCITPRPWVNRECSAVGKTQRALWSWLIRRSRWSQAVSSRSSSAASSSGRPAARGFVARQALRQLEVAVDRVADEVDGGERVARHLLRIRSRPGPTDGRAGGERAQPTRMPAANVLCPELR